MGITANPPDRQGRPLRRSGIASWTAIGLAVASLLTFALTALVGLNGAWLAVAMGAGLLALALLVFEG